MKTEIGEGITLSATYFETAFSNSAALSTIANIKVRRS